MKTSACLSKLNSIPSQKFILRKRKSNSFLFVFFWIFGENFSKFELNTWGHLCRNCLVSVQMNHFGKKFGIVFFLLWWWAETIRLLARKTAGLLKLHSTSPEKHFEERSWHVLVLLGAWTDFFINSIQKLGASLSELHCRWPEEPFAQNKCFWEG